MTNPELHTLSDHDALKLLRTRKPARKAHAHEHEATFGQKISDAVATKIGSWPFIIIQSVLLALWISANILGWVKSWDPYPFILLNLMLSFQSAYAAPIIMMAQNRQGSIDRKKAELDYDVNLKAELEIELLHQKMDLMRDQEIKRLTQLIEELTAAVLKKAN